MYGGPELTPLEFFQKLQKICKKHNGYPTCQQCPLYKSDRRPPYLLCNNLFYDTYEPCTLDEDLVSELIYKVYETKED